MALETWNSVLRSGLLFVLCTYTLIAGSRDSIRLLGGASDKEGFVQVNVRGVWKAICRTEWDALDALVVCRELGFADGYVQVWREGILSRGYHANNSLVTVTPTPTPHYSIEGNEFACNGTENSLLSCKYNRASSYCIGHAGVACGVTTKEYGALLADSLSTHGGRYVDYTVPTFSGKSTGRVLSPDLNSYQPVYKADRVHVTGGVCNMDKMAAMLICGDQGYPNGGKVIHLPPIPNLPKLIHTLTCIGATRLWECDVVYTEEGLCPDGVQYNSVECYTKLQPSVFGSLAFLGVASILILIAGAFGVSRILRKPKTLSVPHPESHEHS
ncbi:lysyl oxidase homolog 2 [Strongylocentrotus purpuratus]|uniref:SRCR domain-containing protein n=1 Tax=Strongylocentrotus purpuratus TaxID=7668 RepID=A0A7M7GIS1_STRPU|nr:lysyl oxidase homolog 2 [Strongylocentrotus purpuratus]|eukprot:XP_003729289.1 PREDICTED: lysyl oxidase homolog 2 [Strongylocentrotus purpuratus]